MDNQQYIMSIDQGTTSSRAVLINQAGHIIASGQEEFPQYYPENGWVEQDPEEIWQSVQSVISEVFIKSGIHPNQVAAIGITNQRETSLIWDRHTGKPIYPAIVWQSRQTADICQNLIDQGYTNFFQDRTGLMIDAYFSATKVRWILDRVEGAQAKAEEGKLCFGTIDSWLLWKLTGGRVHATDYTNASRTMLFNIHDLNWDSDILDLLKIPKAILPGVKSNSEIFGYTDAFQFFGKQVPITAMAGDQQAALFGHLAFEPGMAKSTYGTGAFIVMNTGKQVIHSQHKLLSTIAYVINNEVTYALEGSIFVAGSAIQWLRDGLGFFNQSSQSESLAQASKSKDEIYLVPAFTGLGAPYWDPAARGTMFGLTRATNQADITKASLQSIAYQVKDIVDTMEIDSKIRIPQLRVDGGASLNNYLLQFQADIINRPIYRAKQLETTALGIGYLAGLAIGYWQDLEELKGLGQDGQLFQTQMAEESRQQLYNGWKKAVKATQYYASLEED